MCSGGFGVIVKGMCGRLGRCAQIRALHAEHERETARLQAEHVKRIAAIQAKTLQLKREHDQSVLVGLYG